MARQFESDKWHWIALGSGGGATVLLLLFLYAPNGVWKLGVGILLAVTLAVLVMNPRYRLFGLGTAAALTGLAGFVTEISFSVSATLPGGGVLNGGVNGGTDVHPVFFIFLLLIGLVTIAFDNVGRGWIWSSFARKDTTRPELEFCLESESALLSDEFADAGQKRFHVRLSVSKDDGDPVQLVRIEIKDATILEFGTGTGDGVQYSRTIERTGTCDLSILGSFPDARLSAGCASRDIVIVDQFNRRWSAGKVQFHLPS